MRNIEDFRRCCIVHSFTFIDAGVYITIIYVLQYLQDVRRISQFFGRLFKVSEMAFYTLR